MSYTIPFSNPAKSPIIILDGTSNVQSTSLTLVGKNYPGYGQAIETDLVHMLENFASSAPPQNPIEGQIWFDTSDPNNKKLKINDGGVSGTTWAPVGGVFQQPTQPTTAKVGDIWVDTANQQLNFYNGLSFTLVGPNYSSVTRTGCYSTSITDTTGASHNVIINYVNDVPIEITSSDSEFIPNPILFGFNIIFPGTNFSTANLGTNSSPIFPLINGVSNSSFNLTSRSTGNLIPADSFMQNDSNQSLNGTLNITVDADAFVNPAPAIQIGTSPTFILSRISQYTADFSNTYNEGRFTFQIANSSGVKKYAMILDGSNQLVTINDPTNVTSTSGLAINGLLSVLTSATVGTFYTSSTSSNATAVAGNSAQIAGGLGVGNNLFVSGSTNIQGPLTVGSGSVTSPLNPTTSLILAPQDATYDLGDPNVRWRNVYATTFTSAPGSVAQFIGIVSSATYLASASAFSVTGDMTGSPINFKGGGIPLTFTITATNSIITGKSTTATSTGSDLLLLYTNADTQIHKQSKTQFLKDMNYYDPADLTPGYSTPAGSVVPLGTILPYGGIGGTDSPPGWLLCNGALVPAGSKYANLRTFLGTKYDTSSTNIVVPNLTNVLASTGSIYINYIIKY